MKKNIHEIRDPVHGFVRYSEKERDVINSRPFQRLRHIRQLAMSSYVYPGATHNRFEHSLLLAHGGSDGGPFARFGASVIFAWG